MLKVDHLRLIKCFSIAFSQTTVETTRCESTNICAVDTDLIENKIFVTTKKERKAYRRWTQADPFKIDKYAAENGNTAAVANLNLNFLILNESIVRGFKKKYNITITNVAKEKREVSKIIPKYSP